MIKKKRILNFVFIAVSLGVTVSALMLHSHRLSPISAAQAEPAIDTVLKINTNELTDSEFTELLKRSLKDDVNGLKLLQVSESIEAKSYANFIEFTAVIDLDKVEQVSPEARNSIEKINGFLFFIDRNRMSITVSGEPVVRNGLVGIRDNFSIKLGPIPISNDALRQLGVDVAQANSTNLKLANIVAQSIEARQAKVVLGSN